MRRVSVSLLLVLLGGSFLMPAVATARDTDVLISANGVITSDHGKSFLFDIPIYMKGVEHPRVAEKLRQVMTNQSTRGAFRSDDASCRVAFLSAAKVLQERAQAAGGDAVIDVVSITRHRETEDATSFRCVAGTFVVHVGLKGLIVKLE